MNNLSNLVLVHNELDELFALHQTQLVRREFAAAHNSLCDYKNRLEKHMNDEETILIPIYDSRGNIDPTGKTKMFLDEHEKLRNHIDLFLEHTKNLVDNPDPDLTLLWLIEREAFYKKLIEHHDIREERFLYPELDRITSESERIEILTQIEGNATQNPAD